MNLRSWYCFLRSFLYFRGLICDVILIILLVIYVTGFFFCVFLCWDFVGFDMI